jgi:hypothetical protein
VSQPPALIVTLDQDIARGANEQLRAMFLPSILRVHTAGDRLESEVTSLLWMSNYLINSADDSPHSCFPTRANATLDLALLIQTSELVMCLTRIFVDSVQFMIIIIGSGGELRSYVKRVRVEMGLEHLPK